ncbi:ALP1-like protein isoform X1 [Tanacetum coccineum]
MNSNDLSDIYVYYTQLDMEQYTQYLEYFEQYEAMEEDEAESSVKHTRRYIARDRELAKDKLRRDYFGDENTAPVYPEEYFRRRKPTLEDIQHIYDLHERKHGLPGMLRSIDCMHWEWGTGANNDLNVLYGSPLFDDLLADKAPEAPFQVNGKTYEKGYYLADEIYPQWATFFKAFTIARDLKTQKFKRVQESARKDIERAFGVLQGRWGIIQQPARAYHMNTDKRIMYCCMILHNMILEDQKFDISEYWSMYASPESNIQRTWVERCERQRMKNKELRNRRVHEDIRQDIMDHLWNLNYVI